MNRLTRWLAGTARTEEWEAEVARDEWEEGVTEALTRLEDALTPKAVVPEPSITAYITTLDDRNIRGILVHRDEHGIVLRHASIGGTDPERNNQYTFVPMAGDVVVPMANLAFWQQGAALEEMSS